MTPGVIFQADPSRKITPGVLYNASVARFVVVLVVSLLTFSASGVTSLIVEEPCTSFELTGQGEDEGGCPPTCVTCGCCAQAVEPVTCAAASAPDAPIAEFSAVPPDVPNAEPGDILHVPRPVLA